MLLNLHHTQRGVCDACSAYLKDTEDRMQKAEDNLAELTRKSSDTQSKLDDAVGSLDKLKGQISGNLASTNARLVAAGGDGNALSVEGGQHQQSPPLPSTTENVA